MSNRLSSEFAAEFSGAEKRLADAAAAGERTGDASFVNILSFFLVLLSPPFRKGVRLK